MLFCRRCRVGGTTETIIMGVSGKWIKALVGLKKSERSKSSEKDENVGAHLIILFNAFACSMIYIDSVSTSLFY